MMQVLMSVRNFLHYRFTSVSTRVQYTHSASMLQWSLVRVLHRRTPMEFGIHAPPVHSNGVWCMRSTSVLQFPLESSGHTLPVHSTRVRCVCSTHVLQSDMVIGRSRVGLGVDPDLTDPKSGFLLTWSGKDQVGQEIQSNPTDIIQATNLTRPIGKPG